MKLQLTYYCGKPGTIEGDWFVPRNGDQPLFYPREAREARVNKPVPLPRKVKRMELVPTDPKEREKFYSERQLKLPRLQ